ncbi:MAG: HAD family hydrolase [Methylococcales bacterium]
MTNPTIFALDFDGVICDSAVETAITGWKAAGTLWQDMPKAVPQPFIEKFRLLRPMIETGYEAILVMRLLHIGETIDTICRDYNNRIQTLLHDDKLSVSHLKQLFGETRDAWIEADLADWINMNPLFSGVTEKLHALSQQHYWYVVTTKQERFIKQILKANAIDLADERIFGMDRNMSKVEVMKTLLKYHPNESLTFVEDRLPALLDVQKNAELAKVKLIFALWGYNTDEDKALACQAALTLQQLENFLDL